MIGKTPPPEGTVLLQLRRQSGWTQARLERTARLSRGILSLYETGKRSISRPLLNRLAVTLGHSIEDVHRALAALVMIPTPDAPPALTPASLLPHEHRAVEAAAERAAARVRLGVGTRLIEARLRSERDEAANLWDQLRKLPTFRSRRARIDADSRFRSWALCERLCDESLRAMAFSIGTGHRLADLALKVANMTPGNDVWQGKVQGYAWAFVANSLRVTGDIQGSEASILRAGESWGDPAVKTPLDGGQIFALKASLRHTQNRFHEARELLSLATKSADLPGKRARLQLMLASLLEDQGAHEEALETLDSAENLVVAANQYRQRFELEFVRTVSFCHLGQLGDASKALDRIQRAALALGNELDIIRVHWLSAEITAGLGRVAEAIAQYSEVWQAFSRRNMTFYADLVALDKSELIRERQG